MSTNEKNNKYEILKSEILSNISPKNTDGNWFELNEKNIDEKVITEALKKHKYVYIPYIGFPIVLNNPIIMSSGHHLKVSEYQILMQGMNSVSCLLRNENVQNGKNNPVDTTKRDKDISVEGGIWNIRTRQRCKIDNSDTEVSGSLGSIIISGAEDFSLRNIKVFDSYVCGPEGKSESSYGIQLSNCKNFIIENIYLGDNHRDGVHIDGPAEYGLVRHIRAEKLGDDLVSILAWDWFNSAISFGPINHIYIDDVAGPEDNGNEIRILPGEKIYPDGTRLECDIRDCILENIQNLSTIKIYEQHNIENPVLDFDDSSGTVGRVDNIYFKDISFVENKHSTGGAPVNGMFDVCCEFTNCSFENIHSKDLYESFLNRNVSMINVGPNSYTFKTYGEVFNPDSIAYIDNISIQDVTFAGKKIVNANDLISTVNKKQGDFRLISLGKGKGYGYVGKLKVL